MKKLVLIGAAVAVLSLPAMAADLPRKAPAPMPPPSPVYNWTGFYVGVNGGWGWAKTQATVAQTGKEDVDFNPASLSTRANGALFGGQVGYNYQFGSNWVLGIEGDFDGTGMSKSAGVVFPSLLAGGLGRGDGFAEARKSIGWRPFAAASDTLGDRAWPTSPVAGLGRGQLQRAGLIEF